MIATAEARFAAPKIRQTNMLINGKWVESRSGKRFKTINPVNETVIAEVAEGDPADVDAAVKAARAAFDKGTWANMPPANRKRIMLKLAELMMKNREELALLDQAAPPPSVYPLSFTGKIVDPVTAALARKPGDPN